MASQSHEPTFYLLKRRIPAVDSAQLLGRIIRQYQDPTFDYTPQSPSKSLTPEIFNQFLLGVQHDNTAHFQARASKDERLWAKMKGLLSLSSASAEGGTTLVIAPRVTTRRLQLEPDYFRALKAVPEARRKILDMCPVNSKVYLIVGTMSIQTATFQRTGTKSHSTNVSGSLPVGAAASAAAASAGIPLPLQAVPNPEAGIQRSNSSDWAMDFSATATGANGDADEAAEEVFAISCKEITRDWKGFGGDVKMQEKAPGYAGGQHFGSDHSDSDEESDDDEEVETLAAESLSLAETRSEEFAAEALIFNPVPDSFVSP